MKICDRPNSFFNHSTKAGLTFAALTMALCTCFAGPGTEATSLRCEYDRNPTAVGELKPRLSWVVESRGNQRGVMQAAYQVLVASRPEWLDGNRPDAWDS